MFKPRKVGWSHEGSRGLNEGGGKHLEYLKRGWNRKEGRGNKDFKNGRQAGSRSWSLKKGRGGWNPVTNCDHYIVNFPRRFYLQIKTFHLSVLFEFEVTTWRHKYLEITHAQILLSKPFAFLVLSQPEFRESELIIFAHSGG